ncbi:hypothetical protein H8959_013946 [Pygathrix nigripes]
MSGYDRMLRTLGGNLMEFIENLDALHSYLALSYQTRKGIIEAVAKDFFDIEVTMDILEMNEEVERTGKKEHVVFLKAHRKMRKAKSERLQDSQGIERDQEALQAAFLRMKEKYLNVSACPVKKSHWDVVRSMVMFGKGHLMNAFEPIYPERLWIEEKTFCNAFPFHIVFDESVRDSSLYSLGLGLSQGREFKNCTILFSDVVTFTDICAACEPIQIVNMLNSMYSKFDRLTSVHTVYKVETIGDAYMVVGGVPVPTGSHAQRVANFALGMRISAKEVMNPVTGEPIQHFNKWFRFTEQPTFPACEIVSPTCHLTGSELRLRCEAACSQQARHCDAIRYSEWLSFHHVATSEASARLSHRKVRFQVWKFVHTLKVEQFWR